MKSMKKTTYLVAITLVIAGLVVTSASSMPMDKKNSVTVNKINAVSQELTAPTMRVTQPVQKIPMRLDTTPAIEASGDQLHPTFGRSAAGIHMVAFYDADLDEIIWTYSDDDGMNYDSGIYYSGLGGDYPSFKNWDANRFFGTYLTDYLDLGGGPTYLYEVNDATQLSDTTLNPLTYWDWSSYGWYDMLDIDIACDSHFDTFDFGIEALVTSTTYGSTYVNGPTIMYATSETGGTISWYYGLDGCEHADIDIDLATDYSYAAYDWYNDSIWKLVVRVSDFSNMDTGFDAIYDIVGTGNLQFPAVAAYNDKTVVLAQTDEAGNNDIVCLYSANKMVTVSQSTVADDVDDETYPDVRVDADGNFVCTFFKNDKLYKSTSDDGGVTWSVAEEIDDAVAEYKSADITDFAVQGLFEKSNGADVDIWLTPLAEEPVVPIIEIVSIAGGLGVSADIKNTGTGDATNVNWSITVTGGILKLINKTASGTIASLAVGATETVKTGIIFGLGTISITVTADTDTATATGKQLIIFSKI